MPPPPSSLGIVAPTPAHPLGSSPVMVIDSDLFAPTSTYEATPPRSAPTSPAQEAEAVFGPFMRNMVSTAREVEQTMPLLTTVARHTPQDFATTITHSVVSQFAGIHQAGLIKTVAHTDPLLLPVLQNLIQAL